MVYCYYDYYAQGHYGAQGRYFAGYLQIFLLSLMMTAGWGSGKQGFRIVTAFLLRSAGGLILFYLFFNPLLYIEHQW